ncbi:DNA polymerase, related [Neospora caninum Liverpool]|uniref:DNA polymerase zeta catalytic subunit n=1 Tax=Neospora caninum (strain Liverpool) TaxID=572307 RepID=F0VBJ0_NEOCL|nr:DNA polymerase, related [Neospora caninum Liverpool]CBZ50974.1 DNA polymerase, related [Neospora caninum Liverpool]|eukprot:XP_003881007.1 DNA polymerase, related [Neospora caninum Liverpool]
MSQESRLSSHRPGLRWKALGEMKTSALRGGQPLVSVRRGPGAGGHRGENQERKKSLPVSPGPPESLASDGCPTRDDSGNALVMSVSVTVVEPCLEAPVPGLDPAVAPFSGRRIWRVPVLRIYGVVNENPLTSVAATALSPAPTAGSPPSELHLSSISSSSVSSTSARCPRGDGRFLGRMCCVTVHNVFPYFFIPLPREAHERPEVWLQWFSAKLRACEEKLTAHRGQATSRQPGQGPSAASGSPLLFALRLVKKRAFYGYDHAPRLFVKISTLHPGSKTVQLAALLLQGRVTGSPLQPFEIHIPFVSHFLADFHLRGMDLLTFVAPSFVQPLFLAPPLLLAGSARRPTDAPECPLTTARAREGDQARGGAAAEKGWRAEKTGRIGAREQARSRSPWELAQDRRETHSVTQAQRPQGSDFMHRPAAVPGGVFLSQSWAQLWRRLRNPKASQQCGDEGNLRVAFPNAENTSRASSLGLPSPRPPFARPQSPSRACGPPASSPAMATGEEPPPRGTRSCVRVLPSRVPRRTKCELECHVMSRHILNPFFISASEAGTDRSAPVASQSDEKTKASTGGGWERTSSFAADLLLRSVLDFWREEAARCAGLGIPFPFDSPNAALPAPPTLPSAAAAVLAQRDETPARGAVPEIFKRRLAQLLDKTGALRDVSAIRADLRGNGSPRGGLDRDRGPQRSATGSGDSLDRVEELPELLGEIGRLPAEAGRSQGGRERQGERQTLTAASPQDRGGTCEQGVQRPQTAATVPASEATRDAVSAREKAQAGGEGPSVHGDADRQAWSENQGCAATHGSVSSGPASRVEQYAKRLRVTPPPEATGDGSTADRRTGSWFSSLFLSLPPHAAEDMRRPCSASQSSSTSSCPPLSPANASGFFIDSASLSATSQLSSLSASQDPLVPDAREGFQSPSSAACPLPGGPSEPSWHCHHAPASAGEATEKLGGRASAHPGGVPVVAPPNAATGFAAYQSLAVFSQQLACEKRLPREARGSGDTLEALALPGLAPSCLATRLEGPTSRHVRTDFLSDHFIRTEARPERAPLAAAQSSVLPSPNSLSDDWRDGEAAHGAVARVSPPAPDPNRHGDLPVEARLPSQHAPLQSSYSSPQSESPSRWTGPFGRWKEPESGASRVERSEAEVVLEQTADGPPASILEPSAPELSEAQDGEFVEVAEDWRDPDEEHAASKVQACSGREAADAGPTVRDGSATVEAAVDGKDAADGDREFPTAGSPDDDVYEEPLFDLEEEVDSFLSAAERDRRPRPRRRRGAAPEPDELFALQVCSPSQSSSSGTSSAEDERRARQRRKGLRSAQGRRRAPTLDSSSCSPTVDYDSGEGSSGDSLSSEPSGAPEAGNDSSRKPPPEEEKAKGEMRAQPQLEGATRPVDALANQSRSASMTPDDVSASGVQGVRESCKSRGSVPPQCLCVPAGSAAEPANRSTSAGMRQHAENISLASPEIPGGVKTLAGTSTDARQSAGNGGRGEMGHCLKAAPRGDGLSPVPGEEGLGGEEQGSSSSYAATVVLSSGSDEACGRTERASGENAESKSRQENLQLADEQGDKANVPPEAGHLGQDNDEWCVPHDRVSQTGKAKSEGAAHNSPETLARHPRASQVPCVLLAPSSELEASPAVPLTHRAAHDAPLVEHCSVSQQSVKGWPDEPAELPFFGDPRDLPLGVIRAVDATLGGRSLREQETVLGARRAESIAAAAAAETRLLAERRAALGKQTRRRRRRKNARRSQVLSSQRTASQSSLYASRGSSQQGSQRSERLGLRAGADYHPEQGSHLEHRQSAAISTDGAKRPAQAREAGSSKGPGQSDRVGDAGRAHPSLEPFFPGKIGQPTLVVEISSSSEDASEGASGRSASLLVTGEADKALEEPASPVSFVLCRGERRDAARGGLAPSQEPGAPGIAFWGFYRPPPSTQEALASCPPSVQKRHERLLRREIRREARHRQRHPSRCGEAESERPGKGAAAAGRGRLRGPRDGGDEPERDVRRSAEYDQPRNETRRNDRRCRRAAIAALRWTTRMDNVGRIVMMLVPATQSEGDETASSRREKRSRSRRRSMTHMSGLRAEPVASEVKLHSGAPSSSSASPGSAADGPRRDGVAARACGNSAEEEATRERLPGRELACESSCMHPESCPRETGEQQNLRRPTDVSEAQVDPGRLSPALTPSGADALTGNPSNSVEAGDRESVGGPERDEGNEAEGAFPRQIGEGDPLAAGDSVCGDRTTSACGREQHLLSSQRQQHGLLSLSVGSIATSHTFSSTCSSSDISWAGAGEGDGSVSQLSVAAAVKDAAKQARPFQGFSADRRDEAIRGKSELASYGALLAVEVLAERRLSSPEAVDAGAPDSQHDAILGVALVLRDERLALACGRAQASRGQQAGAPRRDGERRKTDGQERDEAEPKAGKADGRTSEERHGGRREEEGVSGEPLSRSASETEKGTGGTKAFLSTARGERRAEEAADGLAYFDASIIVFVDQVYKPRLPLNSQFCASPPACPTASAPWPSTAHLLSSSSCASPFVRAQRSFADFVAVWQSRHPFTKAAQQQLTAFLPPETELVAVDSERALLHRVCLIFSVADPSMVLQWDGGSTGLGFLLRRARVLGVGLEVAKALGRRADPRLLSCLQSVPFPPRSHTTTSTPATPVPQQSSHSSSSSPTPAASASPSPPSRSSPARDARPPAARESGRSSGVSDVLRQGGALSGRLLLECWRLLQSEVKLQQSSLEGVTTEVLGKTFASVPPAILANLWKQGQGALRRAERRDEVELMTAWRAWQQRVRRHEETNGQPTGSEEGADKGGSGAQGEARVSRGEARSDRNSWALETKRRVEGQRVADAGAEETGDGEKGAEKEGTEGRGDAQSTLVEQGSLALEEIFEDVERTAGCPVGRPGRQPRENAAEVVWAISTMGAVLKYLLGRVRITLALIDSTELLPRTAELARLYGCDFFSALTRGSQFKVESVMIQATKRLDYLFVSPSQSQVTEQPAPLCIPLVLEPKSGFYWSPVLVLDFRSLYPSIVIANNICYSTAMGSVEVDPTVQPVKTLGVMDFHAPPALFQQISGAYYEAASAELRKAAPLRGCQEGDNERQAGRVGERGHSQASSDVCTSQAWDADSGGIRLLPSGAMFVSRRVRKGIFPQVLSEILQTRIMVQKAIKKYKGKVDEGLLRLLNYRQYGLKMIANVSYGYTAASFTGHMPCADIADAIVQTARTTLMRAIELVHSTPRWGGRVLYGDTDSLFVLVQNKSLEAAFEIGREIAYTVTQQNPAPVELELEKGIEAIRRDQCGCTSSILESTLQTFFASRDISQVKAHLYRQWTKILSNQVPLKDFIFYKKCRLGSYKAEVGASTAASLPPQAKVAYARLQAVARPSVGLHDVAGAGVSEAALAFPSGPSRGERVAFVYADLGLGGGEAFLTGKQTALRLLDCAVSPEQVEGGGRADNLVSLFLYGAPQKVLRPMPLQLPESWSAGSQTPQHEGGGDLSSQHGASLVWLRCWENMPSPTLWGGTDAFSPEGGRMQGASAAFQAPAARLGGRRPDMSAVVACFSRSASVPAQHGQELTGSLPSVLQRLGDGGSEQLLLPIYLKYYIVRQIIPALDRLFGLLPGQTSVDLRQWFDSMPKPQRSLATRLRRRLQTDQQIVKKLRQGMLRFGAGPPLRERRPESGPVRARDGPPPRRTPGAGQMAVLPKAGAVSPAAQPRQKLLQALKISNGAGGGSKVRLHHFFAASACLFCGAKCSLLPPGAVRGLTEANSGDKQNKRGSAGGPKGGGSTDRWWRRRTGGTINFEEDAEADIRAQLFRKLECRNFTSDDDGEGNEHEKIILDLSSSSTFSSSSHGSIFSPLFQPVSLQEQRRYWQPPPVCAACSVDAERLLVLAYSELREEEKRVKEVEDICETCAGKLVCRVGRIVSERVMLGWSFRAARLWRHFPGVC